MQFISPNVFFELLAHSTNFQKMVYFLLYRCFLQRACLFWIILEIQALPLVVIEIKIYLSSGQKFKWTATAKWLFKAALSTLESAVSVIEGSGIHIGYERWNIIYFYDYHYPSRTHSTANCDLGNAPSVDISLRPAVSSSCADKSCLLFKKEKVNCSWKPIIHTTGVPNALILSDQFLNTRGIHKNTTLISA